MRALVEFSVIGGDADDDPDVEAADEVVAALADYGWTMPDLGIERGELVAMAREVAVTAGKAGRDLPISPHSQLIQSVIDRCVAPDGDGDPGRGSRFERFSFERHCIEQALLILTQIPEIDHGEVYTREMVAVVGPEFGVYGLVLHRAPAHRGTATDHYIVHLRCRDLERLQKATAAFVSALNPVRHHGAPAAAVSAVAGRVRRGRPGRRRERGSGAGRRLRSIVSRLQIRSEADELLFTANVVPICGRFTLLQHSFANLPARVLTFLSLALTAASALLYWLGQDEGWWRWSEQLTGRLATGAFGALLVDAATDYVALRRTLVASAGPFGYGSLLDWSRA